MLAPLLALLLAVLAPLASCQLYDTTQSLRVAPVYFTPLDEPSNTFLRGYIQYDKQSKTAIFRKSDEDYLYSGIVCVSMEEDDNRTKGNSCPSTTRVDPSYTNYAYQLQVSMSDEITGVYCTNNSPDTASDTVTVLRISSGPVPAMKEPIKLVNNKIPEEPEEKTFLQKYWVYLVPFALMMLVSGSQQQS